jgi:hypothetical protein
MSDTRFILRGGYRLRVVPRNNAFRGEPFLQILDRDILHSPRALLGRIAYSISQASLVLAVSDVYSRRYEASSAFMEQR